MVAGGAKQNRGRFGQDFARLRTQFSDDIKSSPAISFDVATHEKWLTNRHRFAKTRFHLSGERPYPHSIRRPTHCLVQESSYQPSMNKARVALMLFLGYELSLSPIISHLKMEVEADRIELTAGVTPAGEINLVIGAV